MENKLSKEVVESRLHQFAKENGVRILMAVESGSRGWGFPGRDSDWDCRFIYTRPQADYEAVYGFKEQLDYVDMEFRGDLDMTGWDLRKVLRTAANSNIVMSEWAQSPLRYKWGVDGFAEALLQEAIRPWYRRREGLYAYLGMANNARSGGPTLNDPTTGAGMGLTPDQFHLATGLSSKKFLYYARCVLAAGASMVKDEPPPMDLPSLLRHHETEWNKPQIAYMQALVKQKEGLGEKEKFGGPVPAALVQWLHSMESSCLAIKNGLAPPEHPSQAEVNAVYRSMLERWA